MSIASHLQNIATSLTGILSRINTQLVIKGSTEADTLTQVDEKIAAIPQGGGLQPLDSPASSSDIRTGKKAYSSSGTVITGSIPVVSPPEAQLSSVNNNATTNNVTMTVTQSSASIVDVGTRTSYGTINSSNCPNLVQGNIKSGVKILGVTGSYSGGGTSGGDAVASDIRSGKTAYVDGSLVTGDLRELTSSDVTPSIGLRSGNQRYVDAGVGVLQSGILNFGVTGSNSLDLQNAGCTDFLAENIKQGKTIFGLTGSYSGGSLSPLSNPASASDIRSGKKAYADDGTTLTGNLQDISLPTPVIGVDGSTGVVSAAEAQTTTGVVTGSLMPVTNSYLLTSSDCADFIPSNIKSGATIFGVAGTYSGGSGFTGCELGSAFSSGSVSRSYDGSLNRDYLHISLSDVDSSRTLFGIYVVHSASVSSITPYVNSFIALKIYTYWSITCSTEGNTLPSTEADVTSNVFNVSFRGSGQVLDGSNYTAYPIYGTSY